MHNIENLRNLVFQQSGAFPVFYTTGEIFHLLGYNIEEQETNGYDIETIEESKQINELIHQLLSNKQVDTYLYNLVPEISYKVSNVKILCLEEIKEILENGLPIFKFGYLPFALTNKRHGLFCHPTGKVFSAERHVFYDDSVSTDLTWHYFDKDTKTWSDSPFEEGIVERKLITLSSNFELFISDLLNNELREIALPRFIETMLS
jgi:hypothetical protein